MNAPRLEPYALDPEAVCAERPDVCVVATEALEIALREVLDEDEACDAVLIVLREGWSPRG